MCIRNHVLGCQLSVSDLSINGLVAFSENYAVNGATITLVFGCLGLWLMIIQGLRLGLLGRTRALEVGSRLCLGAVVLQVVTRR